MPLISSICKNTSYSKYINEEACHSCREHKKCWVLFINRKLKLDKGDIFQIQVYSLLGFEVFYCFRKKTLQLPLPESLQGHQISPRVQSNLLFSSFQFFLPLFELEQLSFLLSFFAFPPSQFFGISSCHDHFALQQLNFIPLIFYKHNFTFRNSVFVQTAAYCMESLAIPNTLARSFSFTGENFALAGNYVKHFINIFSVELELGSFQSFSFCLNTVFIQPFRSHQNRFFIDQGDRGADCDKLFNNRFIDFFDCLFL